MIGFLVGVFILGVITAVRIIAGARRQARRPDYPRGRIATIVGLGQSLGWWLFKDSFGYHRDRNLLPPEPTPTVKVRLEELQGEAMQAQVEQKTQVQEMLGG